MKPTQIVGPLILIGVGVLFLLSNFALDIPVGEIVRDYWPMILIVIGLANLVGVATRDARAWGRLNGGIILITVGTLFQLQQIGIASFHRTWPVLLVVIGGLGLLRVVLGPMFFADRTARPFRGGFR